MRLMPLKRQFLSTRVGSELVVLVDDSSQAVCLNAISAVIWNLCDGSSTVAAIAEVATVQLQAPVTEELVQFALRELGNKKLLEEIEPLPGFVASRRTLVRQLGVSAAILLPVISMVAIPRKVQASGGSLGCTPADTPIQLAGGAWLPAADVRANMWLRAFHTQSGQVRDARVESVHPFMAPAIHTLFTERGDMLQSSPSHLLIAGADDVDGTPVAMLKAGDKVMAFMPGEKRSFATRLTGVQISNVPRIVYGIEMASDEHTYVAAHLVSHNKSSGMARPGFASQSGTPKQPQ